MTDDQIDHGTKTNKVVFTCHIQPPPNGGNWTFSCGSESAQMPERNFGSNIFSVSIKVKFPRKRRHQLLLLSQKLNNFQESRGGTHTHISVCFGTHILSWGPRGLGDNTVDQLLGPPQKKNDKKAKS